MKGSISRWDGLRDCNESSSSQLFSRRHNMAGHGGEHSQSLRCGRHASSSMRNNESVNDRSWRRPQKPTLSTEEEMIRDSVRILETKVASYSKIDPNSRNDCDQNDICKSLDELSISFSLDRNECKPRDHSSLSLDVLWEAGVSTIRCMEVLHPSASCKLVTKISNIATACSLLSYDYIQHSSASFHRPGSMTDLRISECASIVLQWLGDGTQMPGSTYESIDCKSSLFQCLAKILSISTILGVRDSSTKNKRSLLFPWGAEKTVNLVVVQSILPFVEKVLANASMPTITKTRCCCPAIECLYMLLRDPSVDAVSTNHQLSKHAAAILAPLIIDVDPNGQENERPNPLRSRTLKAIVTFWDYAYQLDQDNQSIFSISNGIQLGCQCLVATLNSLYALRRGKLPHPSNEVPPIEIDVAAICSQVQSALQNQNLFNNQSMFFHLLSSVCRAYPGAAARQWHLFIEQSTPLSGRSKESSSPLLLKFVEDGIVALRDKNFSDKSTAILPDALQTIVMLISAMPFSHWIAQESKLTSSLSGENYFASRVRNSTLRVIECTHSLIESIRDIVADMESVDNKVVLPAPLLDSIMDHTSKLAAKLCSILPFSGRNSVLLLPASTLVGCSGEIYVVCLKAMQNSSDCTQFYEKAADLFSHVMTDTVDAVSNQTLSPSQHWLSDSTSFELIDLLLYQGPPNQESKRMSTLSRIARICPWALVREPFNLASFCELCTIQCNASSTPDRKMSGVKLIESFLIGRRIFSSIFDSSDTSSAIVDALCPILLLALKDKEAKVRAAAATSFGYISKAEWHMLLGSKSNETSSLEWQYLDAILQLSSKRKGENNSKVRADACKAIGDICTSVMDSSSCTRKFVVDFTRKVSNEMEKVLKDECSCVKSMVR